jgi:hypothetical protein
VPAPNAAFVAISAGAGHSLGLKADGSVVAWGPNLSCQCTIPAPNNEFVAATAGGLHSLVLKSDGKHMFFDLEKDPEQAKNLAGDPASREEMRAMGKRILAHHEQVASPAAQWLKDVVVAL